MNKSLEEQSAKVVTALGTIQTLQKDVSDHASLLSEHSTILTVTAQKTEVIQKEVQAMYRELSLMENSKVDRQLMHSSIADINQKLKEITTAVALKENHLVTIENFIEKYLPIKMLT